MDKLRLEKMMDRYRNLEGRNYFSYQQTGIQRYQYLSHQYQDIADAAELALSAADDHYEVVSQRVDLSRIGRLVEAMLYDGADQSNLKEILALCRTHGYQERAKAQR